jgi:hypothetical protein
MSVHEPNGARLAAIKGTYRWLSQQGSARFASLGAADEGAEDDIIISIVGNGRSS